MWLKVWRQGESWDFPSLLSPHSPPCPPFPLSPSLIVPPLSSAIAAMLFTDLLSLFAIAVSASPAQDPISIPRKQPRTKFFDIQVGYHLRAPLRLDAHCPYP